MKKELINVIVSGFPKPLASQVAQACKKRGLGLSKFGLASSDLKESSFDVPEVGKLEMIQYDDKKLVKSKLREEMDKMKQEKRFTVVADMANDHHHSELFNECHVPFVMQTTDHQARHKAVANTERSKHLAVIAEDFNKHFAAFDSIMREWGRQFPGLFRGYQLAGDGMLTSTHLSRSISDLFDKDFTDMAKEKDSRVMEGSANQEFSFKNGKGSSTFTFRRTADPEEFADGVVDSIEFLAHQIEKSSHPKVYNILDVTRMRALM